MTTKQRVSSEELEEEIWEVLDEIPDPHIPVSLVDMGMIYEVDVSNGDVEVIMTYPCMGCPAYEFIQNDIKSAIRPLLGVDSIEIEVTWDPVWSKDMLTEDALEELQDSGIAI